MQTKTVITPCGSIVGCVTDYGASFRGVKYATAKRFEKPVLITKYDTEQIALEQGVCCPQMRAYWNEEHRFYYQEFRKGKSFKYSEDCLILDIHVPSDAHDCPVIVFIHGGSFTGGSINEMQFDGSAYTKRGVIFVAINYRLNVFGFFADNEHCGGNLGLYDQYTAIEWVRQNIASFGGNPDNITLMGQSAGAMSIQTLICSDKLKGKVKGAIMLSGGGKEGRSCRFRSQIRDTGKKSSKQAEQNPSTSLSQCPRSRFGRLGKRSTQSAKLCAQTRYRRRFGQGRKIRHRRSYRIRHGQKRLVAARAQPYGKSVCAQAKEKGRALLRLFAYEIASARQCVLSFLRPLVCSRFASKIVEAVYGARLRLVRRDGGQICGVCKDEQSKRQGQTAMENVFFKVGYQSVRLKKRWLILRIKIV